jgi:holdfast attachment protein HfaA
LAGALVALATPAAGDDFDNGGNANQHFGFGFGQEEQPFDPGTRDANGNRVIINGRIMDDASTLPGGLQFGGDGFGNGGWQGSSAAIGNQLNVVTNGNNNIVIIENEQINTGDQTAIFQGE